MLQIWDKICYLLSHIKVKKCKFFLSFIHFLSKQIFHGPNCLINFLQLVTRALVQLSMWQWEAEAAVGALGRQSTLWQELQWWGKEGIVCQTFNWNSFL